MRGEPGDSRGPKRSFCLISPGGNSKLYLKIPEGEEETVLIRLSVNTTKHTQMTDITGMIRKAVEESGFRDGICTVFVPHTTAAVTINENADPDVVRDFTAELGKIVPWEDGYRHMEGNSAAHLKASMMGFSQQIIVDEGKLLLGTWQGIWFCEFDGPRSRSVYVKLMGDPRVSEETE